MSDSKNKSVAHDFVKVTPRAAKRLLMIYLRAGLVPFLKSSPGMGKSSLITAAFHEMKWAMRDHRMSTSLPEDQNGLPDFTGEGKTRRATFVPFDIFPLESDPVPEGFNGHGLFLDEFNSADRQVQATCYKLILDRKVGQATLHPDTAIVLAGNLDTDNAIVNDLSTAMQSRVAHILMEASLAEWLQDVAYPQDFAEQVISYVNFAGTVSDFDPDHDEETFLCPRTLEFLSKSIKGMEVTGAPYNPDNDAVVAAGIIGASHALRFNAFMRVYSDIPTYEDIVKRPMDAKVAPKKDGMWATMGSIGKNFEMGDLRPVLQYTDKFPSEMKIMLMRMLRERNPEIQTEPDYVESVFKLSKHLNGKPLFEEGGI